MNFQPPVNLEVHLKNTLPQTPEETNQWIAYCEDHIDTLKLDVGAATTVHDNKTASVIRRKLTIVRKNLEALFELRRQLESGGAAVPQKRPMSRPPPTDSKRQRGLDPPPPPTQSEEPTQPPPCQPAEPAQPPSTPPPPHQPAEPAQPPSTPPPPPRLGPTQPPGPLRSLSQSEEPTQPPPSPPPYPPPMQQSSPPPPPPPPPSPQQEVGPLVLPPASTQPGQADNSPATKPTVEAPAIINPADMDGLFQMEVDQKTVSEPPLALSGTKTTPHPADEEALGTEDGEGDTEYSTDASSTKKKKKNKKKKKKSEKAPHLPDNWELLNNEQRNHITDRGQRDYELMVEKGKFLSSSTRTWIRRAPHFLCEAVCYSQCAAASCFIQKTGRTICHYHNNAHDSNTLNDLTAFRDEDAKQKVTGVPHPNSDSPAMRPLSYLERPKPRVNADGCTKVSNPLRRNPNFTLDRVLEFFPVVKGIRSLHCGCRYDEALFDFYMWKMTMLWSPATDIEEDYGKLPMKPRDRHYMYNAISDVLGDLDLLFEHDRNSKKLTAASRTIRRAQGMLQKASKHIVSQSKKKQSERDRERAKAHQNQVKKMYVEIESLASRARDLDSSSGSQFSDTSDNYLSD